MKTKIIAIAASAFVLGIAGALTLPSQAGTSTSGSEATPADKSVPADFVKAKAAFVAALPGQPVNDISAGPLPGWVTVVYGGTQVAYVIDDARHVVFGNVLRSEDRHSYTVATAQQAVGKAMASLPADQAIVFGPENAATTITVFTDTSCGFCKKLHTEVPALNAAGVAVAYYPWPRGGENGPGYQDMRAIWCSADPRAAYEAAMKGEKVSPAPEACNVSFAASLSTGDAVGVRGTPGVFLESAEQLPGYMPAAAILKRAGLAATP